VSTVLLLFRVYVFEKLASHKDTSFLNPKTECLWIYPNTQNPIDYHTKILLVLYALHANRNLIHHSIKRVEWVYLCLMLIKRLTCSFDWIRRIASNGNSKLSKQFGNNTFVRETSIRTSELLLIQVKSGVILIDIQRKINHTSWKTLAIFTNNRHQLCIVFQRLVSKCKQQIDQLTGYRQANVIKSLCIDDVSISFDNLS